MPLDPEVLPQRIEELSKAYQRQMDKAGQPGYDPILTELLKKDLTWLQEQQGQGDSLATESNIPEIS